MHTFFQRKVVRIMPKSYDGEFRARAVRLFTDHAEEYDTGGVRNPVQIGLRRFWLRWVMLRGGDDSLGGAASGVGGVTGPQLLGWLQQAAAQVL